MRDPQDDQRCAFYAISGLMCSRGCPRTWNTCHRRADENERQRKAMMKNLIIGDGDYPRNRTTPKPDQEIEAARSRILDTAKQLINGDRNNTYGDARDDFTRTGKMWAAVLGLDTVTPEQVALCMALVKIGRLCESPNHEDSWVDGCGYLALGGEIATRDA